MYSKNDSLFSPKVLLSRSHFDQLAIGGAMMDCDDPELEKVFQVSPASGGWNTRFDQGHSSDLPYNLVAMNINALIHITGGEDDWDEEIITEPSCYGLVVFRKKSDNGEIIENYIYLYSRFGFVNRITKDGRHDLSEAHFVASRKGLSRNERSSRRKKLTLDESLRLRDWHMLPKKDVPGNVRQILHRTIDATRTTADNQFGQGKDFFEFKGKERE